VSYFLYNCSASNGCVTTRYGRLSRTGAYTDGGDYVEGHILSEECQSGSTDVGCDDDGGEEDGRDGYDEDDIGSDEAAAVEVMLAVAAANGGGSGGSGGGGDGEAKSSDTCTWDSCGKHGVGEGRDEGYPASTPHTSPRQQQQHKKKNKVSTSPDPCAGAQTAGTAAAAAAAAATAAAANNGAAPQSQRAKRARTGARLAELLAAEMLPDQVLPGDLDKPLGHTASIPIATRQVLPVTSPTSQPVTSAAPPLPVDAFAAPGWACDAFNGMQCRAGAATCEVCDLSGDSGMQCGVHGCCMRPSYNAAYKISSEC
jgi:hypothetical protein